MVISDDQNTLTLYNVVSWCRGVVVYRAKYVPDSVMEKGPRADVCSRCVLSSNNNGMTWLHEYCRKVPCVADERVDGKQVVWVVGREWRMWLVPTVRVIRFRG